MSVRSRSRFALLAVLGCGLVWSIPGLARPNTHGLAISTWDVRASSLAFSLRKAASGEAEFQELSAAANFSSSSGLLSAQFGVHYLNFHEEDVDAPDATGASMGGVAMFHFPLGDGLSESLPPSALNVYVGALPTMLIGVERNYLSLPLVLGLGVTWSPSARLSFTPWGEVSRSLNLDTRLQAVDTQEAVTAAQNGQLSRQEVERLVKDGLALDVVTRTATRWGLNGSFHMTPRVDLDINLLLGAGSPSSLGLGASLVIRWDDFVGTSRPHRTEPYSSPDVASPSVRPPARPTRPARRLPAPRNRRPRFRQIPANSSQAAPPQKGNPPKRTKTQKPIPQTRIRRRPRLRVIPQP